MKPIKPGTHCHTSMEVDKCMDKHNSGGMRSAYKQPAQRFGRIIAHSPEAIAFVIRRLETHLCTPRLAIKTDK